MRKYYIDNLRWITIIMLIPYHAAMAWNIWEEPNYIYFGGNKLISSIVVFLSPYAMPLLFLIAGISTKYALQKRTYKQYILERFKKLLIPFISGTLLIMPLMAYIADKFNYGYKGSLLKHYYIFFTNITDLTGADGCFSVGQFWFILYLFIISLISVPVILLQKKFVPVSKKNISGQLLCFLGVPLPVLSQVLAIGGKSLAEYIYFFFLGYYIFSDNNVITLNKKYKLFFFFTGLTATVLNTYFFIWSGIQYGLAGTIIQFISRWFMLITLAVTGKDYLNLNNLVTKYMSKVSFAFYYFHFIWIVLFQYLMAGILRNNIILLYIVPVLLAYAATFLCCGICIKIPFLCRIIGIQPLYKNKN